MGSETEYQSDGRASYGVTFVNIFEKIDRAITVPRYNGKRGALRRGALRRQRPYLRSSRFQGVRPLQRKENSSRGSRRRLLVRLRYRIRPREANIRVRVREY